LDKNGDISIIGHEMIKECGECNRKQQKCKDMDERINELIGYIKNKNENAPINETEIVRVN
jgi:CxxC motif-containing protein (DUF1111 family)